MGARPRSSAGPSRLARIGRFRVVFGRVHRGLGGGVDDQAGAVASRRPPCVSGRSKSNSGRPTRASPGARLRCASAVASWPAAAGDQDRLMAGTSHSASRQARQHLVLVRQHRLAGRNRPGQERGRDRSRSRRARPRGHRGRSPCRSPRYPARACRTRAGIRPESRAAASSPADSTAADVLPVGRRAAADIHRDVPDRAAHAAHQLALRVRRDLADAGRAPRPRCAREAVVVLHEGPAMPASAKRAGSRSRRRSRAHRRNAAASAASHRGWRGARPSSRAPRRPVPAAPGRARSCPAAGAWPAAASASMIAHAEGDLLRAADQHARCGDWMVCTKVAACSRLSGVPASSQA